MSSEQRVASREAVDQNTFYSFLTASPHPFFPRPMYVSIPTHYPCPSLPPDPIRRTLCPDLPHPFAPTWGTLSSVCLLPSIGKTRPSLSLCSRRVRAAWVSIWRPQTLSSSTTRIGIRRWICRRWIGHTGEEPSSIRGSLAPWIPRAMDPSRHGSLAPWIPRGHG